MCYFARALAACIFLVGAVACHPEATHAATPQLYVYTSTSGDFGQEQTNLNRWRNFIGAKEAGWVLFNDYTSTGAAALGNCSYGLGLARGHGVGNVAYSIPLAFQAGPTLDQVAAGANDANYTACFKLIATAFPNAQIRLGWEEDGEWYVWSATTHPAATFVAAWNRIAALARAQGLRVWLNPAIGRPANMGDPGPTAAPDVAYDVYQSKNSVGGVTAEPAMISDSMIDWWMMNTLTSYYPERTKAVWEFGMGEEGDDPVWMAGALAKLTSIPTMEAIGVWDSSASYPGTLSDGSKPASALELLKVFGPAAIKTQIAGASLYTGTAYKASAPAGYHAFLAQLANGHVEQLAWGDQAGQTLQATDLTAAASAASAARPAVTVTQISPAGATVAVTPNADGSEVLNFTFPNMPSAVDYVFTLSAPRQLGFAGADGKLAGYTWQGGREFTVDDWRAAGGTAQVYVAPY